MKIPDRGEPAEALFAELEEYRAKDVPWREGRTWAYVYDPGPEASEVIRRAYTMYLDENGLDPTAFPSVMRLENEIVAMAAAHLGGDENVVGNFTSGGTESIILAVKAARDRARAERPEITRPEMILPVTAHASFQKAAHYLGVECVVVPVDPTSYRADVDAVRAAITPNTILLVGSAISYAHGVVDPIPELGQLALEHDLWLHVDGCMGGFLLPYFRRLGGDFPEFDFRVPGVTTISMDLHKYAFAAKGASTILHRSRDTRRYQIYTCAAWAGYAVVNPTVQSTRGAGPLAAAWAVLRFIGDDGYLEMARTMKECTDRIVRGIGEIDGLEVIVPPDMNLLAFAASPGGPDIFQVADEMNARGWFVQPQLGYEGSPANIHLSINPASARWVDDLLADLARCVQVAGPAPGAGVASELEGALAALTPASLTGEAFEGVLGLAGVEGMALPERMAEINRLLDALPAELRAALLTEYINELLVHRA